MFLVMKIKFILYTFQKKSYNQTLNLLLITEKDKSPYAFIKDFNRLMFSRAKHKDKKHHYLSCLQSFTTEDYNYYLITKNNVYKLMVVKQLSMN